MNTMPDIIHYVTAKRGRPLVVESSAVLPPSAEYASGNVMEMTNVRRSYHNNGELTRVYNNNCTSIPYTSHFIPHTQMPAYQIHSTSVGNTPYVNVLNGMEIPMRDHVDDALGFINEVRNAYILRPQIYSDFLNSMRDFKAGIIGIKDIVIRVSHLFIDHTELIVKFKTFLPFGYKIDLRPSERGNGFQVIVSSYNGIGSIHIPAYESNFSINVEYPPL